MRPHALGSSALGVFVWFLGGLFISFGVSAQVEVERSAPCKLRLLDDRGVRIEGRLSFCLPGAGCREVSAAQLEGLELPPGKTIEVEGERHGPFVGKATRDEEEAGRCTVRVPRKTYVLVLPPEGKRDRLTVSFYRASLGTKLGDPTESLLVTSKLERGVYLPADDYLVALTLKGWAPDLRWIPMAPGAEHTYRFRARDGWSLALRTVTPDSNGSFMPIDGARIDVEETAGFETNLDSKQRPFKGADTRDRGIFLLSGIESPMITASARHPDFVAGGLPAVSSPPSTFHFFELLLDPGATLDVELTEASAPVVGALCELQKPKTEVVDHSATTVWSGMADGKGRCRAETLEPGLYSLRISRDGLKTDARREVELRSSEIANPRIELRKIRVSGAVRAGSEPAVGEVLEITPLYGSDMVAPEVLDVAETDEDGRYALTVGASGTYGLRLVNADHRRLELDGDASVDFELSTFQIVGRVVDADGEPLPDAAVVSILERGTRKRFLKVEKDGEGGFRCRFPKGGGTVEMTARRLGYEPSEPTRIEVREDVEPPSIDLVLHRRPGYRGTLSDLAGAPMPNAWVAVYGPAAGSLSKMLDLSTTDENGRFELAVVGQGGALLFFGGRGCALGARQVELHQSDHELALSCGIPANLRVQLKTEDENRSMMQYQSLLLRVGDIVIPEAVLRRHLSALGLPFQTDSSGRLGLLALEAGEYDLFHGGVGSERNLQSGHEAGYLASAYLDPWVTVGLDISLNLEAPRPFELALGE